MKYKENKISKTYRFYPETIRQVEKMAIENHVSETYIIESAIHEAWFQFQEREKYQKYIDL